MSFVCVVRVRELLATDQQNDRHRHRGSWIPINKKGESETAPRLKDKQKSYGSIYHISALNCE